MFTGGIAWSRPGTRRREGVMVRSILYRVTACCFLLLVPGGTALTTSTSAQAVRFTFRTVILSGTPAPGVPGEVFSRFFLNPRIDRNGRVAFYADLQGRTICTDGTGIWSERTGALELVALE